MITVKATREGLIGHQTASGYYVDTVVSFVALPSENALFRFVRVINTVNDHECIAQVLDVGPWNIDDDAYVFGGSRPQAESGIDKQGRKTNGAGIDLGEKVWTKLGMQDNSAVMWEFVS